MVRPSPRGRGSDVAPLGFRNACRTVAHFGFADTLSHRVDDLDQRLERERLRTE